MCSIFLVQFSSALLCQRPKTSCASNVTGQQQVDRQKTIGRRIQLRSETSGSSRSPHVGRSSFGLQFTAVLEQRNHTQFEGLSRPFKFYLVNFSRTRYVPAGACRASGLYAHRMSDLHSPASAEQQAAIFSCPSTYRRLHLLRQARRRILS